MAIDHGKHQVMSVHDLIGRARQDNVLISVLLELTYECNLDCFFCYNDRGLEGKALTLEQYFDLLKELQEMQVLYLTLSGGEPLAHPDFFVLGAKARELGFLIKIKTNGHALNHRLAKRIKETIDPYGLEISLHGATAATHDRQTQVPGSFDKLMANLQVIRNLGLSYKLNATITRWNEHEIEAMYALADQLGARLGVNTSVTPRDDGDTSPLSITASEEAIAKSFQISLARSGRQDEWLEAASEGTQSCSAANREGKQCGTGSTALTIDPVGNILPCVQWRRPLGNLHNDSVKVLWENSAELEDVRKTSERARRFVDGFGKSGRLMKYCIGEAVVQTGKPVGLYPIAQQQMESRLRVLIKD